MDKNEKDKSKVFRNSLPIIDYPFKGESLIGYTLRLDFINGFSPGTLLKKYLYFSNASVFDRTDIVEYAEYNFDYEKFSSIVNIPRIAEEISMKFIVESKYEFEDLLINNFFYRTELKLCPICIREWRLPMNFLVKEIDTCVIHKTKLIKHCTCGERITIWSIRKGLYCIHTECNKPLYELINIVEDNNTKTRNIHEQLNDEFFWQPY